MTQRTEIKLTAPNGALTVTAPGWPGMKIGPARCGVVLNGKQSKVVPAADRKSGDNGGELEWHVGKRAIIRQNIVQETPGRLRWRGTLENTGRQCFVFNHIDLLTISRMRGGRFDLGSRLAGVRVLENDAYYGQVRSVGQIMTGIDGRKSLRGADRSFYSNGVALFYSPNDDRGLLIAFESFDRFKGEIKASASPPEGRSSSSLENVDRGTSAPSHVSWVHPKLGRSDRFTEMSIGFGGADLSVEPGEVVQLEEFVIEVGSDPHQLLEDYADRVAAKYQVKDIPKPFANWCSWYPYRLGVTEQRMIETAKVAKERYLDRLGLRFIQVDLGWEKDNVPTYFEENERFSHGLKWLSENLEALGFELGAWKGFACVSGGHPVAKKHKDWLVSDDEGNPKSEGQWFWEPHDDIFSLDVTHPGVQEWIRENISSLAERGVGYLKWDFGGSVTAQGNRHNPKIACSGAFEGMRIASEIVRDAMNSRGKEGLVLDCTTCETANIGRFKMFYTNSDTGNTGLGFHHLRSVYTALATHLFKNQRWALLQPSCLVVGLPGTLEEARVRATVTFLTAGHTDIGDDLTTLPEERWRVLLSVLPPAAKSARVIDLFHPVRISAGRYKSLAQGAKEEGQQTCEPQGATVWHLPVQADWDEWHVVGLLNWFGPEKEESGAMVPLYFEVGFELLGLDSDKTYWAHEFWSSQFLGEVPLPRRPEGVYRHPGDMAALVNDSGPGVLNVTFHGPAVKLLVIRKPRSHPWPVGTTFHLSGGLELAGVNWDKAARTLSGELHRPPGQTGSIIIAGVKPSDTVTAIVDGVPVPAHRGANGSLCIPLVTRDWVTKWSLRF